MQVLIFAATGALKVLIRWHDQKGIFLVNTKNQMGRIYYNESSQNPTSPPQKSEKLRYPSPVVQGDMNMLEMGNILGPDLVPFC